MVLGPTFLLKQTELKASLHPPLGDQTHPYVEDLLEYAQHMNQPQQPPTKSTQPSLNVVC